VKYLQCSVQLDPPEYDDRTTQKFKITTIAAKLWHLNLLLTYNID